MRFIIQWVNIKPGMIMVIMLKLAGLEDAKAISNFILNSDMGVFVCGGVRARVPMRCPA